MRDRLYVHEWGSGTKVVLVHGSGSSGAAFKPLFQLEGYRFVAPDRHGYGRSPDVPIVDFDDDAAEVADLLGEGTHLVGQSYGGVVALLAAARRPEAVRSLAVNEPPAFGLGRGHPAVDELIRNVEHVYATKRYASPEEFEVAFGAAVGFPPMPPAPMDAQKRRSFLAMMAERSPVEAAIPLGALAAAPFPKLVISGAWSGAFDAVCAVLIRELRAESAVFPGTGHSFISKGEPLVRRLVGLWRGAEAAARE
jgi:pimeloyl-ACP methyl ester carboxylesterase